MSFRRTRGGVVRTREEKSCTLCFNECTVTSHGVQDFSFAQCSTHPGSIEMTFLE